MNVTRRQFVRTAGVGVGFGASALGTAVAQDEPTVGMHTESGNYFFDPIGLHVQPGTTVTFENVSGAHNVVSYDDRIPDGADGFETTIGETAAVTFEAAGTYDYYCQPHKSFGMVGRVVVGEPGGAAEGSMPPDGEVPDSQTIVDEGAVSIDEFGSGSSGGGGSSNRLTGAGVFGGMAALAAVVYYLTNSEGESYRVGSSEWKEREGVE